jgi:putative ABC transport system ATP-binding protein
VSRPRTTGAFAQVRRGLSESPALRRGLGWTVALALVGAFGRLLVPVLIQQILDKGIDGPGGFQPAFVATLCGASAAAIVVVYLCGRLTYVRMVRAAEQALYELRVRTFAHIHELSIAEQSAERRGTFLSRVTNDVDTLADFMEWSGIIWITSTVMMVATTAVMLVYSWQLTLVTIAVVAPLVLVMRALQRRLLAAYDQIRVRVAETMAELSESVMGAAVIRAYGLQERIDRRLKRAIRRQYQAQVRSFKYGATIFPASDLFGALATAAVFAVGVTAGPGRLGLSAGDLIAFLFLVALFLEPLGELSETLDHTQTAVAGWRKVLGVLDLPVEVREPKAGVELPHEALSVRAEDVDYAYREGGQVLHGVDLDVSAGTHVAIVGETGSGKTTLAKLLCRLADPTSGRVLVGGVDLREVAPDSRRAAIRMVPQDGFLFDTTVSENVRVGTPGASAEDVQEAFAALGLHDWVGGLPAGLETSTGERGENLSVGERQLVALVRAQLAGAGLLILDEATSAVDPETERALAEAMRRVAEGRTTVTIAHRLSTAQAADFVLVFDRGRIVERGTHDELVEAGGVYAGLYSSWLGNVASEPYSGTTT